MKLRRAHADDGPILLQWRNDPVTIASSHTPGPIAPDDHFTWFANTLRRQDRRLFIAEADGTPVGSARADLVAEGWLLSWNVAPEHRGHGYGKLFVSALTQSLEGPLFAEVKSGNHASIAIAMHAGLTLDHEEGGVLYFRRG